MTLFNLLNFCLCVVHIFNAIFFLYKELRIFKITTILPCYLSGRWFIHSEVVPKRNDFLRPPVHVEMENFESRLATFGNWSAEMTQNPYDMAQAGFFYTG
jgi:hypothetical protein